MTVPTPPPRPDAAPDKRSKEPLPTFDLGIPVVELTKSNLVAETLEDEELTLRLNEGR